MTVFRILLKMKKNNGSEYFDMYISTKCGIPPRIFNPESEKQNSLVSELRLNKENKTSPEEVIPRCSENKAVPNKFTKFKENACARVSVVGRLQHISYVRLGFSEGRGPNFGNGAKQYKTKKKRI